MIHPLDSAVTDLQSITIDVPRLPKGHGYKGPEFYDCSNTGMAPSIFHSRNGKWVVGPGIGPQCVWIYKNRKSAVAKFTALCIKQTVANRKMQQEHAQALEKASKSNNGRRACLGRLLMRSQLRQLETLDQLWVNHRIRLRGPLPDVFFVLDHGACVESVWTGEAWEKFDPKRYPSLQAAFDDLPTVLRKSGLLI